MSDKEFVSSDTNTLTQRLQNVEKSIEFIQHEHSLTLADLHQEISKWQTKCSDLTFQLAISSKKTNSTDDREKIVVNKNQDKLQKHIERLENELENLKNKISDLNKIIEEKDKILKDNENRLIVNERKHGLELHKEYIKRRELKIELEQRSTLIAQLTCQLHNEKQHQQNVNNRIRLGQIILPNKPIISKMNNEEQTNVSFNRRLSNRSSSLNHRTTSNNEFSNVLFIGRRPPTPPQQLRSCSPKLIESNDKQSFTKRQHHLSNNRVENFESNKITSSRSTVKYTNVLPPIINNKQRPLKALASTQLQPQGEI